MTTISQYDVVRVVKVLNAGGSWTQAAIAPTRTRAVVIAGRLSVLGSIMLACGCSGAGTSDTGGTGTRGSTSNIEKGNGNKSMEMRLVHNMQLMLDAIQHNYKDEKGNILPTVVRSNGQRLYSWRYNMLNLLAPSLELDDASYSHRWDDDYNTRYSSQPTEWYCYGGNAYTNILAITGKGTLFDDEHPGPVDGVRRDTIILIEARDSKINWMEPKDVAVQDLRQGILRGVSTEGVHVGFLDGSVWRLSPNTPVDTVKRLCRTARPDSESREHLLARYVERAWPAE